MTNWSPFLSDEMDAWISGPWPDQQQQTQPLAPHPALQPSHPSTPSLAPFLPPLLNSLTSFHSSLGSPSPSFGFHSSLGQPAPASSPAHAPAFGFGGQSPFTAPALSTSSQLARRRRRDGPSLALSQHPSTGPYRPTRPTDNVPTATATTTTTPDLIATTTASRPNASQHQSHLSPLSRPAANLAPQNLHHTLTTPLHDFPNDDFRQARQRDPNSDDVLDALATGDFSSPSLPPYSPQNPPQHRPQYDQLFNHPAHRQRPRSYYPPAHRLPDPETGLFKVEDEGDGGHDLDDKRTVDSLQSEMPATRKRSRAAAAASPEEHEVGPSAPKRPRTVAARRAATPGRSRNTPRPAASRNYTPVPAAAVTIESDDNDLDSLFDGDGDSGGVELYDLTKSDDGVPKDLFQPVKDSSIKLSTFECVICMDAATNLTVTCCGHMFCAQCLHQAMHTELTKKVCPMCRQRLDKPTPKSKPPAKAFFHLELKLRPSKKNGKQPARR